MPQRRKNVHFCEELNNKNTKTEKCILLVCIPCRIVEHTTLYSTYRMIIIWLKMSAREITIII